MEEYESIRFSLQDYLINREVEIILRFLNYNFPFYPSFRIKRDYDYLDMKNITKRYIDPILIYVKANTSIFDAYDIEEDRDVIIKATFSINDPVLGSRDNNELDINFYISKISQYENFIHFAKVYDIVMSSAPRELVESYDINKGEKLLWMKEEGFKSKVAKFEKDRGIDPTNRELFTIREKLLEEKEEIGRFKSELNRYKILSDKLSSEKDEKVRYFTPANLSSAPANLSSASDLYSYMIIEKLFENVNTFYRKSITLKKYIYLLFQLIIICHILDLYMIEHNDLTFRNILMKKIDKRVKYGVYRIQRVSAQKRVSEVIHYYLPLEEVDNALLVLTDFGEAKIYKEHKCSNINHAVNSTLNVLFASLKISEEEKEDYNELISLQDQLSKCKFSTLKQILIESKLLEKYIPKDDKYLSRDISEEL